MASPPLEQRKAHPYFMYDAIRAQPDALAATLDATTEQLDELAARLRQRARLYLVGIGTSYHAALAGEYLMRAAGVALPVQALQNLDFALYGPPLNPQDAVLVVSHRGTKTYSLASLQRARAAGCLTALLTGSTSNPDIPAETAVVRTSTHEHSSAHTFSYTSAIGVLAALALRLGTAIGADALREIPAAMRAALATDAAMTTYARAHANSRCIWLAGAGPSAVTAQEIALKIRETSYVHAEGMSTEMLLHGPFQSVEADDLFVLLAPAGPGQERTLAMARKARAIGAQTLLVADRLPANLDGIEAEQCLVPLVPEALSTLTCVIPLQLFAYRLALARGTNPDGFRLHDPRFATAHTLAPL